MTEQPTTVTVNVADLLNEAEERHRAAAEAEAYARGRRDALREVLARVQAASRPQQPDATEE